MRSQQFQTGDWGSYSNASSTAQATAANTSSSPTLHSQPLSWCADESARLRLAGAAVSEARTLILAYSTGGAAASPGTRRLLGVASSTRRSTVALQGTSARPTSSDPRNVPAAPRAPAASASRTRRCPGPRAAERRPANRRSSATPRRRRFPSVRLLGAEAVDLDRPPAALRDVLPEEELTSAETEARYADGANLALEMEDDDAVTIHGYGSTVAPQLVVTSRRGYIYTCMDSWTRSYIYMELEIGGGWCW